MLEAFQSLRDKLTTKKQAEVAQTSASASKPGTSTSAVNLDLPPPRPRTTSHTRKLMWTVVQHFLHASDLIFRMNRIRTLMHPRSLLKRSAYDQYYDESDEPWIPSTKPKKHADKSRHKVRS